MHTFAKKPKATQQTPSAKSTIPSRGTIKQSAELGSILHLQRTIGNQKVQRLLRTEAAEPDARGTGTASPHLGHDFSRISIYPLATAIQTKLAINQPGDVYEQEADRIAEHVMRTPAPQRARACPCSEGCPQCHPEQPGSAQENLQTKRLQASDTGQLAAPPIVHEGLRSPGQPLDPATRAFMEPRFGYDFSRVRVHLGEAAATSARNVNAQAYTVGQDIVFGADRFAPEAPEGQRLIAHELTHVVQQSGMIQGNRMGEHPGKRGLPNLSSTSDVRLQCGPPQFESPKSQVPVLGRSDPTPKNDDVVLYHYGDLEARRERDVKTESGAPFKSTPSYPRLTDCDTATCQKEVTQHTGTPQNPKLRYKYAVRIDRTYFNKHFRTLGNRGSYYEYGSKEPIPMEFLRRVDEIAPTSSAPPRLPPRSGTLGPVKPPSGGAGGTRGGPTASAHTDEPSVVVDPELYAGPTGGSRRTSVRGSGGGRGNVEELEEGSVDITAEEQLAITGPTGGQPLLKMIGEWLLKDFFANQVAEIKRLSLQRVNQQVEERLKALEYLRIPLQYQGDIVYLQVTVTRTKTYEGDAAGLEVYDLKSLTVSEWFRQEVKDTSSYLAGGSVRTSDETHSIALPLSPYVIMIFASKLESEIDQLKGATSAQSQQRLAKLKRCRHLLLTKGPHVPSFGFLGSDQCIDVLPMGTPPGG